MPDADLEYDLDQPVTMTKRAVLEFAAYMALWCQLNISDIDKATWCAWCARECRLNTFRPIAVQDIATKLDRLIAAGNRVPDEGL